MKKFRAAKQSHSMRKGTSSRYPGLLRDTLIIGVAVATTVFAGVAGSAFADVGSHGSSHDPWGGGVASHIAHFKH